MSRLVKSLSNLFLKEKLQCELDQSIAFNAGYTEKVDNQNATLLAQEDIQLLNPESKALLKMQDEILLHKQIYYFFHSSVLGHGFVALFQLNEQNTEWTSFGISMFPNLNFGSDPNLENFDVVTCAAKSSLVKYLSKIKFEDNSNDAALYEFARNIFSSSFRHNATVEILEAIRNALLVFESTMTRLYQVDCVSFWAPESDSFKNFQRFFEKEAYEHLKESTWSSNIMKQRGMIPDMDYRPKTIQIQSYNESRNEKQIHMQLYREIKKSEEKYITYLQGVEIAFNEELIANCHDVGLERHVASKCTVPLRDLIQLHQKCYDLMPQGDENLKVAAFENSLNTLLQNIVGPYSNFNTSYTSSLLYISHLQPNQKRAFDEFVKKCQKALETLTRDFKSINDILTEAVSRPTQYLIKLSGLLNNVGKDHSDFAIVEKLCKKAKEAASTIEKQAEAGTSTKLLMDLSTKLKLDTVFRLRVDSFYVNEFEMIEYVNVKNKKKAFNRLILVFNRDVVLFHKKKDKELGNPESIPVDKMTVFPVNGNSFIISVSGQEKADTYEFEAANKDECLLFMRTVRNCIVQIRQEQISASCKVYAEYYSEMDIYFYMKDSANQEQHDVLCILCKDGEKNSELVEKYQNSRKILVLVSVNAEGKFKYLVRAKCSNYSNPSEFSEEQLEWKDLYPFKAELLLQLKNAALLKRVHFEYLTDADKSQFDIIMKHFTERFLQNQESSKAKSVKSWFGIKRSDSIKRSHKRLSTELADSLQPETCQSSINTFADSTRTSILPLLRRPSSIKHALRRVLSTFSPTKTNPLDILMALVKFIDDKCIHQFYCEITEEAEAQTVISKFEHSIDQGLAKLEICGPHVATCALKKHLFNQQPKETLFSHAILHEIYSLAACEKNDSELVPGLRNIFLAASSRQRQVLARLFQSFRLALSKDGINIQNLADALCICLFLPKNADSKAYDVISVARNAFECFLFHFESILLHDVQDVISDASNTITSDINKAMAVDETSILELNQESFPYYRTEDLKQPNIEAAPVTEAAVEQDELLQDAASETVKVELQTEPDFELQNDEIEITRYPKFREYHWSKPVKGKLVAISRFSSNLQSIPEDEEPLAEEDTLVELMIKVKNEEQEIMKLSQSFQDLVKATQTTNSTTTFQLEAINGFEDDFFNDLNKSLNKVVLNSEIEQKANELNQGRVVGSNPRFFGFLLGFSIASTAGYVFLLDDYKATNSTIVSSVENVQSSTNKIKDYMAKINAVEAKTRQFELEYPTRKELESNRNELLNLIDQVNVSLLETKTLLWELSRDFHDLKKK